MVNLPFVDKKDIKWDMKPMVSNEIDIEQPVPELSTIYKTLNPLDYFMNYFPEGEFEKMAKYTNIYAEQKNKLNFHDTTSSEMKVFVGVHLLIGCLKHTRIRLYWTSDFRVNLIADSISRNRFFELRSCFHVINNNEITVNNEDKFIKIRPLYDSFLKHCKTLPKSTNLSIDEQMIKFKGKLGVKQYMKGKPCPWGIKNFLLCSSKGMVYDMLLYQGKSTEIDPNFLKKYGLGASVVLKLVESLEKNKHFLFFDNFFSSYNLFNSLDYLGIKSAGTIRLNRFPKVPIISDKDLAKLGRGASYEVSSKDNKIGIIKWCDNKIVCLGSNYITSGTPDIIKRYNKKEKRYIEISRPEIVRLYNNSMGGVDLHDQLISYYRVFIKSKKWTLRLLFHVFDMATTNSWLQYIIDCEDLKVPKKNILDLLSFKHILAESLIKLGNSVLTPTRKRGRPSSSPKLDVAKLPTKHRKVDSKNPTLEIIKDRVDHFAFIDYLRDGTLCKHVGCTMRTHIMCKKCNVHLCLTKDRNCFYNFHS